MTGLPSRLHVVHLMADYNPGISLRFFGQFSLIQDFCQYWRGCRSTGFQLPIQQHLVGSAVTGPGSIVTPDPTTVIPAYNSAVDALCRAGQPVVVISHFIHKDAAALVALISLKTRHPLLRLVVVLHCNQAEFFRSDGSNALPGSRGASFLAAWSALIQDGGVDAFFAVSRAAMQTYRGDILRVPEALLKVIPNGVPPRRYRPVPDEVKVSRHSHLGLPEGLVLGCTNRWTVAKGRGILEALLDRLEAGLESRKVVFLYPALIHDGLFEFLARVPHRYPRMLREGRLRGFVDISRFRTLPGFDLKHLQSAYRQELIAQPAGVLSVWEGTFAGFLETPVYTLLDIYLRPSLSEAFGLGIVESCLCGTPVLATDRCGSAELLAPAPCVVLHPQLSLVNAEKPGLEYQMDGYIQQAANDMINLLDDAQRWHVDVHDLRARVFSSGLTTTRMLRDYNRLVGSFYGWND